MSRNSSFFYASIFVGLLVWILIFLVLPVDVQTPLSIKTLAFVASNYIALLVGYHVFSFNVKTQTNNTAVSTKKMLTFLIILLSISFVFRYIDLLVLRDLSFGNTIKRNRYFSHENAEKANLFFSFISVIKSVYFIPIILCIATQSKDKLLYALSVLLIFCPIPEAVLMGTRKPFLELILLFVITATYFKSKKLKKFKIPAILILIGVLFVVSGSILFKRVNEYVEENKTTTHHAILDAKYNKFLMPNERVTSYINDTDNPRIAQDVLIMAVHFGQYYTHGLFELEYLTKNANEPTYGAYTFNAIAKFTNKMHLTQINLKKASEASPRKIVYLTAFGGLFIDFKWFSVIFMFMLGVFQRYVSATAEKSVIWKPIFFYLLIINVFLCVLNYMRGSGIYPIIGFFIILSILKLFHSKLHEKSPST